MSYEFLMDDCENCICSQVREGVSSVESFSDIPASVLSRLNPTAEKSYSNGSGTESCQSSQSGTTSEPLTAGHGGEKSMLYVEDSPVRTSALPEKEQESMVNAVDSGAQWLGSSVKLDQASRSWKIHQHSLFGDWVSSFETWPTWGMMQNGEYSELKMPAAIVSENESGFLPRPQKVDGSKWYVVNRTAAEKRLTDGRQLMLIHVVGLTAYMHLNRWLANPPFWEAMMDWPIGWTDLAPLAMDKFQEWLSSHGKP